MHKKICDVCMYVCKVCEKKKQPNNCLLTVYIYIVTNFHKGMSIILAHT